MTGAAATGIEASGLVGGGAARGAGATTGPDDGGGDGATTIGAAKRAGGGAALLAFAAGGMTAAARAREPTGGTAGAVCELVERAGADVVGCAFLIELAFLGGRERLAPREVRSLVTYEEQ